MIKLLGLGAIVLCFCLMLIFAFLERKQSRSALRDIAAFRRLKREMGLAIEAGQRVHLTLGRGGLTDIRAGAAFIGLSILQRIARIASISDRPPIVSSGEAVLAILSQDTLRSTYQSIGAESLYDPTSGQISGLTPLSYAVGMLPVIYDQNVSVNIIAGNLGAEVGIITDAAERNQSLTVGGSDNLSAQAVMYTSVQEPLIGEEFYASGAYLQASAMHRSSLRAQDVFRWGIVGLILIGALLKIMGVM